MTKQVRKRKTCHVRFMPPRRPPGASISVRGPCATRFFPSESIVKTNYPSPVPASSPPRPNHHTPAGL